MGGIGSKEYYALFDSFKDNKPEVWRGIMKKHKFDAASQYEA